MYEKLKKLTKEEKGLLTDAINTVEKYSKEFVLFCILDEDGDTPDNTSATVAIKMESPQLADVIFHAYSEMDNGVDVLLDTFNVFKEISEKEKTTEE